MVGAIVALAAHPTLPLLPSQRATFIRFMVLRCGLANDEPQAYEEALYLLATTVDGAESWLWPSLIRALLDPTYVASVIFLNQQIFNDFHHVFCYFSNRYFAKKAIPVLRALSALAVKIIRGDGSSTNLQKEFSGTKILARCIELLDDEKNRLGVVAFLRSSAPLMGHRLKPEWDAKLLEMTKMLEAEDAVVTSTERSVERWNYYFCDYKYVFNNYYETYCVFFRIIAWEERMVEFLEESVELEGEAWGQKLSEELASRAAAPGVAPFLACVTNDHRHLTLLVDMTKNQSSREEFSRALGFASKRHLETILSLLEECCAIEHSKRNPTRLLGLVRDSKAAASTEAVKANLLRAYAEIARRGDAVELFSPIERHILPWIVRQLNESKDLACKEAGLVALEQVMIFYYLNYLRCSRYSRYLTYLWYSS